MKKIAGDERDALILQILNRIDADTQVVGAPGRFEVWERGWSDAYQRYKNNPVIDSLTPEFIHMNNPVRWHQDFYVPDGQQNELTHVGYMQGLIADWLKPCTHISEFGCGTGFNLVALAKKYPDKLLTGYDFSQWAVQLVNLVGFSQNMNIGAFLFDMKKPNTHDDPMDGVFTYGAIEQLAGEFKPFMEYLLTKKPRIVVHVEPTIELYDPANLVDSLAIRFHRKRGYTEGFLPWLEADERIELLYVDRSYFGSTMMEGHMLMVWRPK